MKRSAFFSAQQGSAPWLVAAALCLAAASGVQAVEPPPAKPGAKPAPKAVEKPGAKPAAKGPGKPEPAEPFFYDSKGHRDPFIPLVKDGRIWNPTPGRSEVGKPTLYGILWDPHGQSIAMLNDTEAKVGDNVEGYEVIEIRKDAVVLKNGGEPVVLQITFEPEPQAPSSGTTKGGEEP